MFQEEQGDKVTRWTPWSSPDFHAVLGFLGVNGDASLMALKDAQNHPESRPVFYRINQMCNMNSTVEILHPEITQDRKDENNKHPYIFWFAI